MFIGWLTYMPAAFAPADGTLHATDNAKDHRFGRYRQP